MERSILAYLPARSHLWWHCLVEATRQRAIDHSQGGSEEDRFPGPSHRLYGHYPVPHSCFGWRELLRVVVAHGYHDAHRWCREHGGILLC
jgi:hypothetical protein